MDDIRVHSLTVINLDEARFECIFPRCGGVCCRNGRPGLEPAEAQRIEENLAKFLPHLRPEARRHVALQSFLTRRIKEGKRSLSVVGGWCVFFRDGCVLHRVGAAEGDAWRYKPWECVAFPLQEHGGGKWHVRQRGRRGEAWDLFCLNPAESERIARDTVAAEVAFVEQMQPGGSEAWRIAAP